MNKTQVIKLEREELILVQTHEQLLQAVDAKLGHKRLVEMSHDELSDVHNKLVAAAAVIHDLKRLRYLRSLLA